MENIGQVNCYSPYPSGPATKRRFVVNLSNGTTPFIHVWDGEEYSSSCYSLKGIGPALKITRAHYRPCKNEFDALSVEMQDHVLNGGLLDKPIGEARPLPDDPVMSDWDYERFQEFALSVYGRRLGPVEMR